MPAPTALLRTEVPAPADVPLPDAGDEDLLLENAIAAQEPSARASDDQADQDTEMVVDGDDRPRFQPAKDVETATRRETRKVPIPPHRMSPLKREWTKIYTTLVDHLKLQVRMNTKSRSVEIRSSKHTVETGALQKAEDFVNAFVMGFDVEDAVALIRLDGIFTQTFEVKDVKTLNGEHLARAKARIAGKDGKMKYAIENVSKTRIVLADNRIHILGGFKEITIARESIVDLILGKPPSKVYGNLRTISSRLKEMS